MTSFFDHRILGAYFVFLRWCFFLFLLPASVFAGEHARLTSLVLGHADEKNFNAQILLHASQAIDAKIFIMENPPRLIIDLPKTTWQLQERDTKKAQWFARLRYANTEKGALRLVIESKREIKKVEKVVTNKLAGKKYQLSFALTFADKKQEQKANKAEKKPELKTQKTFPTPQLRPQKKDQIVKKNAPEDGNISKATEPPPPASVLPHSNRATPIPIPVPRPTPRLPLIVIDAGHGGQDPGAQGNRGTIEKNLTLSYAKNLDAALLSTQRFQTALTRTDDSYISLQDRVAFARNIRGDFFISLHADSHPNHKTKGLSVYTLSEKASDREAASLAEKANLSDVLPGAVSGSIPPEISHALFSLTQQQTNNNSAMFAELLVKKLQARVSLLPHPHRYAGFRVLKAVDIPSVLIELGYLSNPREEFLLSEPKYKKQLVNAIVDAIDEHFVRFPVERSFQ
jgi:N-acetylmuramoyl-L-alanine amidase